MPNMFKCFVCGEVIFDEYFVSSEGFGLCEACYQVEMDLEDERTFQEEQAWEAEAESFNFEY